MWLRCLDQHTLYFPGQAFLNCRKNGSLLGGFEMLGSGADHRVRAGLQGPVRLAAGPRGEETGGSLPGEICGGYV